MTQVKVHIPHMRQFTAKHKNIYHMKLLTDSVSRIIATLLNCIEINHFGISRVLCPWLESHLANYQYNSHYQQYKYFGMTKLKS